jgi:hypothetical protein
MDMTHFLDRLKNDLLRLSLHLMSGVLLFFIALYPDEYKALAVWVQMFAGIVMVGANGASEVLAPYFSGAGYSVSLGQFPPSLNGVTLCRDVH